VSFLTLLIVVGVILGIAGGTAAGIFIARGVASRKVAEARAQAENILKDASSKAERESSDLLSKARDEASQVRLEAERDAKERRAEIQRTERNLEQKEDKLDRRLEKLQHREDDMKVRQEALEKKIQEADDLCQQRTAELEKVAQMTCDQAKDVLLHQVEESAQHAIGLRLAELEEQAKRDANKRAREIVVSAVQRCAVEKSADVSVSSVSLPNDEMKGRIIGREGRNIRAFENATGVDLIVDDTPEAVTLSCFDPVRREIARLALEKLVVDGRIHPARIEELVAKASDEVEESITDAGEQALMELGIKQMNPELIRIIGQLRYRYSYGQNALQHSLEVAYLSGMIAAELGINEETARRAGLLHDIGKAVDFKVEGPHALIGADLAKRYGETPEIVNAIASHHEDVEVKSIYDVIVSTADAISAARPGARRESIDAYVKRLEKLEDVANSFKGVSKAFAIQAGREVRVMVAPSVQDEAAVAKLAYDIARKIEEELKYPGQIKVTAIKEIRASDLAK
jgi:ribonuclease Y